MAAEWLFALLLRMLLVTTSGAYYVSGTYSDQYRKTSSGVFPNNPFIQNNFNSPIEFPQSPVFPMKESDFSQASLSVMHTEMSSEALRKNPLVLSPISSPFQLPQPPVFSMKDSAFGQSSYLNIDSKTSIEDFLKNPLIPNAVRLQPLQLQSPVIQMKDSGFGQFAICFYVNLMSSHSIVQQVPIISYLAGDPRTAEILFQLDSERQASLFISKGNNAGFPIFLPSNQWTHICLTWDSEFGLVNAYVDGESAGVAKDIQRGYKITNNGIWEVGRSFPNAVILSQLQVWDNVISLPEVKQALSCSLRGNILSLNPYIELGTTYVDPCDTSNRCQAYPKTSPLDKIDIYGDYRSYIIEGVYDKLLPKQGDFSFCLWFYIEEQTFVDALYIYDQGDDEVFSFYVLEDGSIHLGMGNIDNENVLIQDEPIKYYHWQHFCITWSGISSEVQVFVNGILKNVLHNFKTGYSLPSETQLFSDQVQYVNDDGDDPIIEFAFKATDINWWNRVITKTEVNQVYSCSGSLPGNIISWYEDQLEFYNFYSEEYDYDEYYDYYDYYEYTEEEYEESLEVCGVPITTSFMDLKDSSFFVTGATLRFGELTTPINKLSEFSICAWVFVTTDDVYDTICLTNNKEFCVFFIDWTVAINLRGKTWYTDIKVDPVWNHICTTWTSSTGEITSYLNGSVVEETETQAVGSFVPSAKLRLYQVQSSPFDESDPTNGFENKITGLNMWDRVITSNEANKSYCNNVAGNVISATTEWKGPEEFGCGLPIKSSFADIKDSRLLYSTDMVYTAEQSISFSDILELSVCAWVYTADGGKYMMLDTNTWSDFAFAVVNCYPITAVQGVILNGTKCVQPGWAHVCITWTNSTDEITLYLNGDLKKMTSQQRTGLWIPSSKFRIYQKQSMPLEEKDPTYGFDSKITDLNLWDRVITYGEAYDAYCQVAEGSIIEKTTKWKGPRPHRCAAVTTSFMDIKDSIFLLNQGSAYGELRTPHRDLNKLSICAWIFINSEEMAAVLCAPLLDGLCFYVTSFSVIFSWSFELSWYTRIDVDPEWTHICVTWTSSTGEITSYLNAYIAGKAENIAVGVTLPPRTLQTFQTQSAVFDENDPTKGFDSKITGINLWDRVITEDEVLDAYCHSAEGNIVNTTTEWRGPTCGIPIPTSFMDIEYINALDSEDTQRTAELTTPIKELNAFSICAYIFGLDDNFYILGTPNDYDFRYFVSGRYLTIKIGDNQWSFGLHINNVWFHACISWLSTTAEFKYNIDWQQESGDLPDKSGPPIPSGKLRIYQIQNEILDIKNPTKGFRSKVTELNMWDRLITEEEVFDSFCHNAVGNIINNTTEWWGPADFIA